MMHQDGAARVGQELRSSGNPCSNNFRLSEHGFLSSICAFWRNTRKVKLSGISFRNRQGQCHAPSKKAQVPRVSGRKRRENDGRPDLVIELFLFEEPLSNLLSAAKAAHNKPQARHIEASNSVTMNEQRYNSV